MSGMVRHEDEQRVLAKIERLSRKRETTGSVTNSDYAKDSAIRAADADFDFDKQKRRVGKDGSPYQTWYDERWSELESQNELK